MDKVQFNTEVVNMRKTVKRVKVLIVHSLTRQVKKLQSKKGSEQQVLKNQRRAARFLAEVEAIKDVALDTFSKKAVTFKKSLQDVLNHPKSSAADRVMARMIHHRLIQERVIKFKDMVTRDLLRTGTKKYRRLRKEKFEAEARARWKDEEDYQGKLEQMITSEKTDKEEDDGKGDDMISGDDEDDSQSDGSVDDRWQRFSDILADVPADGQQETETSKHQPPAVATHSDEDLNTSSDDGDSDNCTYPSNPIRNNPPSDADSPKAFKTASTKPSISKGSLRVPTNKNAVPSNTGNKKTNEPAPPKNTASNMDSVFLGSLSAMKDDDITDALLKGKKETLKEKNKRRLEKQSKQKSVRQRSSDGPPKAIDKAALAVQPVSARHTPMVDQPNSIRQTQGEKLIPGINCYPDLVIKTGASEKSLHKQFPSRPQSKHFPNKELWNKPSEASYPTSATTSTQKIPTAKARLHPSWEASRKRKLESKIVPFQGKKIVFDED